jgi:hypothetical protein
LCSSLGPIAMSDRRWSIWVDIEGFSRLYDRDQARALRALGWLMEAIHNIGAKCFGREPERLFVHHFGDGFVIVSDFHESSGERPLAIAISLLRHLISLGVPCKAAIACGGFGDVFSCYPSNVTMKAREHRVVPLGRGLMTIIPVMGTALISSHKLSEKHPGAVLLIDESCFEAMPHEVVRTKRDPTVVDWMHTELGLAKEIGQIAGLTYTTGWELEAMLHDYLGGDGSLAPDKWKKSTLKANSLAAP